MCLLLVQKDGEVVWSQNSVYLINPSVDQFMEVIDKLEDKHETMMFSECENIQFVIPTILERRTIKRLFIESTFLTRYDILSFSSQLSTNKSLEVLVISQDSISDDGVAALAQSLQDNETLQLLALGNNPGITSASAQPLAELLLTNKTLQCLYLHNTSIDTDGVLILMESLNTSSRTLSRLWLDEQHEGTCSTLPYYEQIRDIITFYTV